MYTPCEASCPTQARGFHFEILTFKYRLNLVLYLFTVTILGLPTHIQKSGTFIFTWDEEKESREDGLLAGSE